MTDRDLKNAATILRCVADETPNNWLLSKAIEREIMAGSDPSYLRQLADRLEQKEMEG